MRVLQFQINGQKLSKDGDFSELIAGTKGYLYAAYNFDGELCTLKHDMLSVRLPQEETLKLNAQRNLRAEIQLRVLTRDGEALASNIETVDVGRILKDGVI